jgi:hypothetical protein
MDRDPEYMPDSLRNWFHAERAAIAAKEAQRRRESAHLKWLALMVLHGLLAGFIYLAIPK